MAKTAPRWWNSTYGIDPNVPIDSQDRHAVEEKFTVDEERNRERVIFKVPQPLQAIQFLPFAIVFIGGGGSIILFGLSAWYFAVIAPVSAVALWFGGRLVIRRHIAPLYRRELRARGYDICIECGYWLCGLGDDVKNCPECGAQRHDSP